MVMFISVIQKNHRVMKFSTEGHVIEPYLFINRTPQNVNNN